MHRRASLLVSLILTALLAACGGEDDDVGGDAAPAAHNEADIAFVSGMIPHHEQALVMSELAAERAASTEVKDLADRIEAAQQPEIDQMEDFLQAWGVEAAGGGHGGGHGGDSGHPGMLTEGQLDQLEAAEGAEFDSLFLRGMIAHHQGAVTASEKELAEGRSAQAKRLASQIIETQRAEINEMTSLLAVP
jgi:uncharacterized protein (DUF305 family)